MLIKLGRSLAIVTVVMLIAGADARVGAMSLVEPEADRVLFIGNSLTASNDLPLLVEALASLAGAPLSCEAATASDFSLEDHWNAGAVSRIRKGGWKYVVLQQGPSSLLSSRQNLREWTGRFAGEIRATGAQPALYMVWPDRSRLKFLPDVHESYRLASHDVQGVLLPVGAVWESAWRSHPALPLYGPDQFHPSRLGTLAAALTIVKGLTGRLPEALPDSIKLRKGRDYKVDRDEASIVLSVVQSFTLRATP